jgi:hypothetical protein
MDLMGYFDSQIETLKAAKDQYVQDLDGKFKEGQASIILPEPGNPDAQYTQAQMDALAVQVREEKDAEYKVQIDALNAQIADAAANVDVKVTEAMASVKKDIANKIKAAQADDLAIAADLEA